MHICPRSLYEIYEWFLSILVLLDVFFFGGGGLYVFLTPPALHEAPEARFNVQQTYSLSSLAFKRVKRHYKHISPPPCYPRYMMVRGTLIRSPQGRHYMFYLMFADA